MFHPVLSSNPNETLIIGAMVIGYGEIELLFGICAGLALKHRNVVLVAFHKVSTAGARIEIANALASEAIKALKLQNEYAEAFGAVRFCSQIRNQFAHCQFGRAEDDSMIFAKAEDSIDKNGFKPKWKGLTLALLKEQEAYFVYTRALLLHLENRIQIAVQEQDDLPRTWPLLHKKPARIPLPPKHTDL